MKLIRNLIARHNICRKVGHVWRKDGDTLGGWWIRCKNCNKLDEYLPGLHEPRGSYAPDWMEVKIDE